MFHNKFGKAVHNIRFGKEVMNNLNVNGRQAAFFVIVYIEILEHTVVGLLDIQCKTFLGMLLRIG